ncbi:MAG: hypothetical protein ACJ8GV_03635 [Luteimonas sp.]
MICSSVPREWRRDAVEAERMQPCQRKVKDGFTASARPSNVYPIAPSPSGVAVPVPSSRRLICAPIALLLCVATSVVAAQDPPPRGPAARGPDMRASVQRPENGRQRAQDSMTESVRRIERNTRGRVLSIEQMHSDGRDLNRVKVMDDSGRVRIFVDDPGQRARAPRARGDDD